MKYNLYLYATSVVKVCGVEAFSQRQAVKQALEKVDLCSILKNHIHETSVEPTLNCEVAWAEYAEDITSVMLDELEDGEAVDSRSYELSGDEPIEMIGGRTRGQRALALIEKLAKLNPSMLAPLASIVEEAKVIMHGAVPAPIKVRRDKRNPIALV